MKKLSLLLLLVLFSTFVFAQRKKSKFWSGYERAYPLYNFTFTMGIGVLPYGLTIDNHINKDEDYMYGSGFDNCAFFGLSYNFNKIPLGFFIERSYYGKYKGTHQFPFPKSKMELKPEESIASFLAWSNGFNAGILYGGTVVDGFEIFGKFGLGKTWHEYNVLYRNLFTNEYGVKEAVAVSNNLQLAIDFRYFPGEVFGIAASLGISQNFPVFSISSAIKFGYKKKKS